MYGGLTTHLYLVTVVQFRYPAIQLSKNMSEDRNQRTEASIVTSLRLILTTLNLPALRFLLSSNYIELKKQVTNSKLANCSLFSNHHMRSI